MDCSQWTRFGAGRLPRHRPAAVSRQNSVRTAHAASPRSRCHWSSASTYSFAVPFNPDAPGPYAITAFDPKLFSTERKSQSDMLRAASDTRKSRFDVRPSASDVRKSRSDVRPSGSDARKSRLDACPSASDVRKSRLDARPSASDARKSRSRAVSTYRKCRSAYIFCMSTYIFCRSPEIDANP